MDSITINQHLSAREIHGICLIGSVALWMARASYHPESDESERQNDTLTGK